MKSPSTTQLAGVFLSISWALQGSQAIAADEAHEPERQAVRTAQALQDSGQWAEAQALLNATAQKCGTQVSGRECRLLARYSEAYLSERQARRSPDNSAELLAAAVRLYTAVLEEAPQHEPTLKNLSLVYRELGRASDAEQLLKRAAETDRSGTGRAALLLGQLYRESDQFDAALSSFNRAAAANPSDAAAPQAIVALYADALPSRLGSLLPRLADWVDTFPAVAERGYRQILTRVPNTSEATAALLSWVSLIARQGWVSPSTFASLPRGWVPLDQLVAYANAPEIPPSSGFWMQGATPRSVLAELALALGQSPEARTDPARSLRRLRVGMNFCPGYEDYLYHAELKEAWPARMELARAQLSLLSRLPTLDPNGQMQRDLIGELFVGKAGAYQSQDLAAMQRFHTTLGRIYAERHEWSGSSAMNARFQLEHAIDTAARRAARGEPYQPMQDEKAALAGGYIELKEPGAARAMYLRAAEAYLDTDQPQLARETLQLAQQVASPTMSDSEKAQTELLRRVLNTREALAAQGAERDFERKPAQAWLREDSSQAFLRRQQFKTLADLTLLARKAGKDDIAAARSGPAFEAALRVAAMIGTADLVRLEQIKALAIARADLGDRRDAVIASKPRPQPGGVTWPLYVPGEGRSIYVSVTPDAVLAGRFDAQLRREPALQAKPLRYSVDNGTIAVRVANPDASATDALARAQRLQGVVSLTVTER